MCIYHRYTVLLGSINIFFLMLAIIISGRIHLIFLPRMEPDHASAIIAIPAGSPLAVADRHIQKVLAADIQLKKDYWDNNLQNVIKIINYYRYPAITS